MKKRMIFGLFLLGTFISAPAQENSFVLGPPGQEGELTSPRGILEGPDGNIYAYDEVDAFIKVYSPQGKFVRKIGGEGQGPGEIQNRRGTVLFGFTADGLLFFAEYFGGHRWITLMKLNGELDRVIKLEVSGFFGVSDMAALPDGGFLAEVHFFDQPARQKDYYLFKKLIKLLRLDSLGKVGAEVKATSHYTWISYGPDGFDTGLPFVPRFNWCLYRDETAVFSEGLNKVIEVYDLSGQPVKQILTELPEPEYVKDKDIDEWREEIKNTRGKGDPNWYGRSGSVIEKYTKSIHKLKPIADAMCGTRDGNILVAGSTARDTEAADHWLLDESGKILARTKLLGRLRLSKSFVIISTADEGGNEQVVCLKRQGTETADFLRAPLVLARTGR